MRLVKISVSLGKCFLPNARLSSQLIRHCSSKQSKTISILAENHNVDNWTNVTPQIVQKIGRNLHNQKCHPLNLIRQRIQNYFYSQFLNRHGTPLFAVFDNISPVVTVHENFDSLMVPADHVSRLPSDSYYLNNSNLLRAHTSAHQEELIRMGFDAFLVVGDVYRRDEIDSSHYPVFHQMEGVRLFTETELFSRVTDPTDLVLFASGHPRTVDRQENHTVDATKLLEHDLKHTLLCLAQKLFGKEFEYRWVDCYFPFTHPSWELEVKFGDDWLEVLGSGIIEQQILNNAGAACKVGWAFGLGLDRLAMKLFSIPDIRLFWSKDTGFLNQFQVENPETSITYKPISQYPQCSADMSFWIPDEFVPNDYYDLVRSVGGDLVEQVRLIDEFVKPSSRRISHCYRIVYRHMERTLTQVEVNDLHEEIADTTVKTLGVEVR